MKPITKRKAIDFLIFMATTSFIVVLTGKWWAATILVPFGLWNFYDGATRDKL